MAFAGLDGQIFSVNPAFYEWLGYTESELRSLSLFDITHPDDVATTQDAWRRVMAGDAPGFRFDKRFIRRDGQSLWADVNARLVRDDIGKPLHFQTVAVDIGDRKRNEVLQAARFAVTHALVTSPGWEAAAPNVLEGLCLALDWELAEYWEVDAAREAMHFVTAWKRPGTRHVRLRSHSGRGDLQARRGPARQSLGGRSPDRRWVTWPPTARRGPRPRWRPACTALPASRCAAGAASSA